MSNQIINCENNKFKSWVEEDEIKCVECFKTTLKENLNNELITTIMLQFVAAHNLLDECKIFIHKGFDVNEKNYLGWTPLMQSVRNGHYLMSKMLIDCGADVDICNNYGLNAIALAVLSKNLLLLQLVLGASTNQESYDKNLMVALELSCLYGLSDIVQWMVTCTILNLNVLSTLSDSTPLMLATIGGHGDIVKLLLDYGSDPLVQNSQQKSAVDIAFYKNDPRIKSLLYQYRPCSPFQPRSPFLQKSPITSHCVFPSFNNFPTIVLPNYISKRHSPLVPLSPFVQSPQFIFNNSPCCCTQPWNTTNKLLSCAKSTQESHSSGSWYSSSWDSSYGCSDIAALISPRLMKNLHPQTSLTELNSPHIGKKRKLFDKQWYSSWMNKFGKKRNKLLADSNEHKSPVGLSVETSSYIDFSRLLFNLGLKEFWPIFKKHELDIGVFLTLTADDLDIMGIKDKKSQTLIISKIENLKRTQLF